MKQSRIYILIMVALLFIITACAEDSGKSSNNTKGSSNEKPTENFNETGFPIVDEEITLKFMAGQAPATNPNWNDVMIFNEYEKMTNMHIEFEMVSHDALVEKRNLALGSGNLPDAFHSAGVTQNDFLRYGKQGIIIPLNDLIDEHAPNFKALMEKYPEIKEGVTMSNGDIYGFPQMSDPEFLSMRTGPKPFINKVWLDELGMDIPNTTEEYYQFLKAVKEEKPSKGKVDEIPFGAPYIGPFYQYLQGAFGVANKGSLGGLMDEDPETGDYRFYPTSDQYKELLEYMHKLYSEELIEQNLYSIDHNQYIANSSEGRYGSIVWYSPLQIFGEELGSEYANLPALEGPHGDKTWVNMYDPVINPGAFVITSANEHPEATVRWIDHFYGEEGLEMFFMGFEGETFEYDENGNPVYMDHILNSKDDLTYAQEAAKYLTFPGGGFPSLITVDLFKGAESMPDELAGAELLAPDIIEDPWLTLKQTEEENEQLKGIGEDIEKYVEEMRDKFIVGSEPLSKWDDYVKTLEGMKIKEYMDIKINAIERQQE